VTGKPSPLKGANFYTDAAAFLQGKGDFPVIILGPGDDRLAHQPDEYIEIDKFLQSIEYYQLLIKKYFALDKE
jgi:succinyl-diaminopimelate desuccinylase